MKVIGITGTFAAGKGTIVEHLVKKHGFVHFSVSDFIGSEIVRRKIVDKRDSMRIVGNDLRAKNGADYIVKELYNEALIEGRIRIIIESIRADAEVNFLRYKGGENFRLIAIDADQETRWKRARKRKSSKDFVSFEEFCAGEKREMHGADPNAQNISAVMARANRLFYNNGTPEELNQQIDHYLKEFL